MSDRLFGSDKLSAAQWEQRTKNDHEFYDKEWDALTKQRKREYVDLTKRHCEVLERQYAEIMETRERILGGS